MSFLSRKYFIKILDATAELISWILFYLKQLREYVIIHIEAIQFYYRLQKPCELFSK